MDFLIRPHLRLTPDLHHEPLKRTPEYLYYGPACLCYKPKQQVLYVLSGVDAHLFALLQMNPNDQQGSFALSLGLVA